MLKMSKNFNKSSAIYKICLDFFFLCVIIKADYFKKILSRFFRFRKNNPMRKIEKNRVKR